jgi:hypothetical protein
MKKHEIYWYQVSLFVKNAFLYHCRDADLRSKQGSRIDAGTIVEGHGGYAIAEHSVPGFEASRAVDFKPTRQCGWQGFTLHCMVHSAVPSGRSTKAALRPFNNAVAELTDDAQFSKAVEMKIPVVVNRSGRKLINVELSTFEKQGINSPRRVTLLS